MLNLANEAAPQARAETRRQRLTRGMRKISAQVLRNMACEKAKGGDQVAKVKRLFEPKGRKQPESNGSWRNLAAASGGKIAARQDSRIARGGAYGVS